MKAITRRGPNSTMLPCPFCGCNTIGLDKYGYPAVWMAYCGNGKCSGRVLHTTKRECRKKWNRRVNEKV